MPRDGRPEVEVAVFIHRRDFNESYVNLVFEPFAVHARAFAQPKRDIGAGAVLVILPINLAQEPRIKNKVLLVGVDAGDDSVGMLRPYFYFFKFGGALAQFFIYQ